MALAALISATREAREPGVALRATFWLAGRTLVERQARLAAAAGAKLIVILVESLPAELVQSIERLRREGLEIVTARTAAEAAAALPAGRLILMADGFVGGRRHMERLLSDDRPVLLAVTDRGFDERFERIDAASRWAGLALIDAELLRDAALMPTEWDLQSTLLRRALQTGVKPLALDDGRDAAELAIVERRQDFAELQRRILAGAPGAARGNWFSRFLLAPIERAATSAIMISPVTPAMVGTLAASLTATGALAFAYDWRWAGLVPLLLATPLEGIAARLARLRLQRLGGDAWWRLLLPVFGGVALVALGRSLMPAYGWGMLLLAAMALVFLIALPHELHGRKVAGIVWLADGKSLPLLMLPFAAADLWGAGLATIFAYAAGSFFWAQYQAHRRQD